ncbi:hypothetical protein Fot_10966 [Forsythia ovata]|uniref:Uncharacterized protein n=1 Tax=Forsythia ovata TaxID=205694 RepID=A0ABD1WIB3_9LAMI
MLGRGLELGGESKALFPYGGRIPLFRENLPSSRRMSFQRQTKSVNCHMVVRYHFVENLPSCVRMNFRENGGKSPYVHNEVFLVLCKLIALTCFGIELELKS